MAEITALAGRKQLKLRRLEVLPNQRLALITKHRKTGFAYRSTVFIEKIDGDTVLISTGESLTIDQLLSGGRKWFYVPVGRWECFDKARQRSN